MSKFLLVFFLLLNLINQSKAEVDGPKPCAAKEGFIFYTISMLDNNEEVIIDSYALKTNIKLISQELIDGGVCSYVQMIPLKPEFHLFDDLLDSRDSTEFSEEN